MSSKYGDYQTISATMATMEKSFKATMGKIESSISPPDDGLDVKLDEDEKTPTYIEESLNGIRNSEFGLKTCLECEAYRKVGMGFRPLPIFEKIYDLSFTIYRIHPLLIFRFIPNQQKATHAAKETA